MPVVDGKKYPYTKEGKAAAKKARGGYAKGGYVSIAKMTEACDKAAGGLNTKVNNNDY
jgi:hypothetical protein|tara:strand:- start:2978 stop:3151 length:174 start_codon:yes stop_codon:yes gene_type:complete